MGFNPSLCPGSWGWQGCFRAFREQLLLHIIAVGVGAGCGQVGDALQESRSGRGVGLVVARSVDRVLGASVLLFNRRGDLGRRRASARVSRAALSRGLRHSFAVRAVVLKALHASAGRRCGEDRRPQGLGGRKKTAGRDLRL